MANDTTDVAKIATQTTAPDKLLEGLVNYDPVPAPVTLFRVEPLTMAAATVAGEALGFVSRNNAATPVTCGVAIDVPEIVFVAVSLVFHDDVMLLPGAKMSRQVPKFENDERASVVVVEPTVIALAVRAGETLQAS